MTGAGAKHDATWVHWLLVQHCHHRTYELERFRDKIELRDDSASLETPTWMHPADDVLGEQAYSVLQGATDVARRVLRGRQQDVVVAGNRVWQAARLVEALGDSDMDGHCLHAPASIWSVRLLYVLGVHGISLAAEHQ